MNQPETKLPDSSELVELKEHCALLQRQATTQLLGLVVLSFTFAFFVGYQVRRAGKELNLIRPQGKQIMEAAAKEEPSINKFMAQLVEYGKTHPDFATSVMAKYRMNTNAAAAGRVTTNAAVAAPGTAR